MLFAGDVVLSGGWDRGFSGVDVQTVLALLGETYREGDHVVVGDGMRHVLGQALFLDAILVQSRHEIRQRPRHAELNLQLAPGEHQSFLKSIDRAIVKPPDKRDKIKGFLFLSDPSWLFFLFFTLILPYVRERSGQKIYFHRTNCGRITTHYKTFVLMYNKLHNVMFDRLEKSRCILHSALKSHSNNIFYF